jgi:hypothetical protein
MARARRRGWAEGGREREGVAWAGISSAERGDFSFFFFFSLFFFLNSFSPLYKYSFMCS